MVAHRMIDEKEIFLLLEQDAMLDKAFGFILDKYQERLYWHIRRMVGSHEDANDVFQNTMIKAYKGIQKFQRKSTLLTWLYRIASNESLTFIKKRGRKETVSIDNEDLGLSNQMKAERYTEDGLAERYLKEAIDELPEKQRIVFIMRYYDEMPYQEIEKVLGTSVGGLKASYHHAAKKIEAYVRKQF